MSEPLALIGIYEDAIDAHQLLLRMRKNDVDPRYVSLIVRDPRAEQRNTRRRQSAVAQSIGKTGLSDLSDWLLGLASLVVPLRGTFLAAGPIGVSLANAREAFADGDPNTSLLNNVIDDFGFQDEEVRYIESRLMAGSILIGVASDDPELLMAARDLLTASNAVHIGAAHVPEHFMAQADHLLHVQPEAFSPSDVVVEDAVAPLRLQLDGKDGPAWAVAMSGTRVVDIQGDRCGRIANIIAELDEDDDDPSTMPVIRYLVVRSGGFAGVGSRKIAVPTEAFSSIEPPVLRFRSSVLDRAPLFDPTVPFSRREERAVRAYFGVGPYW